MTQLFRPSHRVPRRRRLGRSQALTALVTVVAAVALVLSPIVVTQAAEVSSTPLYQQIYKELLTFPCVRLLNYTHSIGCSSVDPAGTTGVLYPTSTQQQLDSFFSSSTLTDVDGYILVIPFDLLSKPTIDQARASGKVNGMLVIEPSSRQQQASLRSHEAPFPDRSATTWVVHDWNPQGTSLLYQDFTGFPMFAIKNTTAILSQSLGDIVSLAESNRQARPNTPTYAAELSAFMSAAHSASDCLRRGFCKPLGGQSVYAPLFNPTPESSSKPVVLLTAALDGKAMFQDLAQAASTRLASVAAVLTAASAISQIPDADRNNWQRRVLVALFNGESWGHIGSRTLANDLDTFECRKPFKEGEHQPTAACPYIKPSCVEPCMLDTGFKQLGVTTKSVSHVLDANVLGGTADQLRVHTTGSSTGDAPRPFPQSIQLGSQPGIPPSPALAFLERNADIQPWILSTLDLGTFPPTYATELDDRASLTSRPDALATICTAADALVRATLTLATGNSNVTVPAANCTLATSLLDCLTNATACPLGLAIQSNVPRTSYASVSFFGVSPTWPALVAATLLSNASAAARGPTCKSNNDCASSPATPTCLGGTCIQSRARYHLGWPAGLAMDAPSGKWVVRDASKPHWVESNWDLTAVRVFARVPGAWVWVEVASGVVVTAATAGGVWWVRRRVGGLE